MSEQQSYTPVHTRLCLELLKATGIESSKVVEASLEFPEIGVAVLRATVVVTEDQMRVALAATATADRGKSA